MPAKSQKQANLMRAALHGADFPKAQAVRETMTRKQLKEWAQTRGIESESGGYNWRSRNNLRRGRG